MGRPYQHGMYRTDNSQSRSETLQNNAIQSIGTNVGSLNKQVSSLTTSIHQITNNITYANAVDIVDISNTVDKLTLDAVKLNTHLATSDNNFSIDNVNTIAELFSTAINKLNFTLNLIHEKKDDIQHAVNYSSILREIFDTKFGLVNPEDDFDIWIFTVPEKPLTYSFLYFVESNENFDNMSIVNLPEPYSTLSKELNEMLYDQRIELIKQAGLNGSVYMVSCKLYNSGVIATFDMFLPDILNPTKFIIIEVEIKVSLRMPEIKGYDTIPPAFNTYLTQIQDKFNNFASTKYDPILGTVYQFGPDNKFNTLKVVSSAEYPSWNDQLIVYSYIPGSNIDMPTIIFNINAELNRHYTGMSEGEIVIVEYAIGPIYYTGVVKMLKIDGYDGLCYQIQTVNINELFPTSVTMTGDVAIQGNLNILRYNGEKVITTDNTRKVVSFHDKVGINQHPYEVNGLLDIDNLTQQTVLGLFDAFVPYSVNSTDIIQFIDYLSIKSPDSISSLFEQGNSLFDYKNQCTVFSVPIKAIIDASDISIIHTDSFVVGDGTSGTVTGLGKSIITSDYSFTRLQQVVKEVNQMLPEVDNANDPSFVFSFVGILQSLDKKSYMKSARAIIDIDNDKS